MSKESAKSDAEIQRAVHTELRRAPGVDESSVGVTVDRGVVTLSGTVDSLAVRAAAQDAAHRSAHVLDVANDLRVAGDGHIGRSDTEVAHAVRSTLKWSALIDDEHIRTTVTHGWVLLEGTVGSSRERDQVDAAVRNLIGVCGVNNELTVATLAAPEPARPQAGEAALDARGGPRDHQ
jgi:osmotically-inducible protein OsmY